MQHLSADVLVIGGGMAGAFAAMKAREAGLDVLLVDKAFFGRSGCSTYQVAATSGIFGASARVNERGEASIPGLFAAGTCSDMAYLPGGHLRRAWNSSRRCRSSPPVTRSTGASSATRC